MDDTTKDAAKRAVVAVEKSRGFIIEITEQNLDPDRVIITAAHCLPHVPCADPASYTEKRTYTKVGRLDGPTPEVLAECKFIDPVNDIAVLEKPDYEVFRKDADAYAALMEEVGALPIADALEEGPLLAVAPHQSGGPNL